MSVYKKGEKGVLGRATVLT